MFKKNRFKKMFVFAIVFALLLTSLLPGMVSGDELNPVSYFTDFGCDSGNRNFRYDFGINVPVGTSIPSPPSSGYTMDFTVSDVVMDPNLYNWMGGVQGSSQGALPFSISNDLNYVWVPRFYDPVAELGYRESQDHWSTIPKTEFRMSTEDKSTQLFIKADGLIDTVTMQPLTTLYFTMRYFDNVAEPFQIRIGNTGSKVTSMHDRTAATSQIGLFSENLNDLTWRTVQLAIQPNQAKAFSYNGQPVFQFIITGTGTGNHVNVMGNIGWDMVKLSDTNAMTEFPADAPVISDPVTSLKPSAPQGFVDNEGQPFFPIMANLNADLRTGSWTTPMVKSGNEKSTWEKLRDAGFNTVSYWNYNALLWNNAAWNTDDTYTRYGKTWTDHLDNINTNVDNGGPGLWAVLDHCDQLGLKVIPDVTEKFRNLNVEYGREGYRTSPKALEKITEYLSNDRVKNSPALFAVEPFDEYAHDSYLTGFFSVPEAVQIRNAILGALPNVYVGACHMLYETTPTSKIWGLKAFDYEGPDFYALDDGYTSSTDEQNFSMLVNRIQETRDAGLLNLPVLRWATTERPQLNPRGNDMSSQIYLALTCEVDGLNLFRYVDPDYDDFIDANKTEKTAIWKRTTEVLAEVNALTGDSPDAILHKQEGLNITGHSSVTGGVAGDEVHYIYKGKISNDNRYLICTRLQNKRPTDTVYDPVTGDYTYSGTPKVFTHMVDDMKAEDTIIEVMFENRTITPEPYGENGLQFTDDYESRGRHVYKLIPKTQGSGEPAATLTGPDTVSGQFTLAYGLEGAEEITAKELTVSYDKDLFEYVSAAPASAGITIVDMPVHDEDAGTLRFFLASMGAENAVNGNADILNLVFNTKAGGTGTIGVNNISLANGEGEVLSAEGAVKTLTVSEDIGLEIAIQEAQSIYNTAVEGIQTGQYPAGTRQELYNAITAAILVRDDENAIPVQIQQAIAELDEAMDRFLSLIITAATGDINNSGGIELGDLGVIAANYGKAAGDPGWDAVSYADINGDGEIGLYELAFIVKRILLN